MLQMRHVAKLHRDRPTKLEILWRPLENVDTAQRNITETTKPLKICYLLTFIIFILRSYVDELKWRINSDRAALSHAERTASEWRQRLPLAFLLEDDISNTMLLIQTMWCDTCDFLKDNNCYSYLSLFVSSFLSRCMRYPIWIHCCRHKRPNYDFIWISRGSVANSIEVRWTKVQLFTSSFFLTLHSKNCHNQPIFNGVI